MNKFDELAEEGFEVSKDTIKFFIDLPMNTFVFCCMVFLAIVGWFHRHLTKRVPDRAKSAVKKSSSVARRSPKGRGR